MSKVTVTGNVTDITGSPDPDQIQIFSPEIRDGVLSTRPKRINPNPLTGAFTVQLEAGPAIARVRGKSYTFTAAAGDLAALIKLGLAVPPDTALQKLQAAVDDWASRVADGRYASQSALAGKADLQGGKVPIAQLPERAIVRYLGPVASQSAMLALVGDESDWCLRTDTGRYWVITGSNPTQIGSWTQIPIPAESLTKAAADAAYDPLRERFSHSFASATSGMSAPAVSDSGHALSWSGTAPSFGVVGGRGGFYAAPGAQGAATYMLATCAKKPGRGRVRFGFLAQGTAGSSVCIAIPSKANLSGSDLTMALHYFSTPTGFEVAVFDNSQSTPKIPLTSGTYDSPLKVGSASSVPVYEMSFSLKGTTLTFTPADGIARKVTDPRLASFGGAFFFAESFAAAFSDHLALVFEAEAGSDSAPYTPVADASAVKAVADASYAPLDVGSAAWMLRNESDFRFLTITYDTTYPQAIASATGKWPDGTDGAWTATSIDPSTQQVLGYTLTYAPAGGTTKTLTQGARTLNSAGATTSAPMPTVA